MSNNEQHDYILTPEQERRREEMKDRGRRHRAALDPRTDMKACERYSRIVGAVGDAAVRDYLPKRIREGMEERGLSVTSLARLAGFPEASLRNKMKSGAFEFADVLRIAAVLGVDANWFMPHEPLPGFVPRNGT